MNKITHDDMNITYRLYNRQLYITQQNNTGGVTTNPEENWYLQPTSMYFD